MLKQTIENSGLAGKYKAQLRVLVLAVEVWPIAVSVVRHNGFF
jgi:hypothetical protein